MIYLKNYFKIFITALNSALIKIKHSLKKGLVFLPTLGKGIDLRTVSIPKKILGITIGTAAVIGFGKFLINKTFVKSAVGRYALPNLQKKYLDIFTKEHLLLYVYHFSKTVSELTNAAVSGFFYPKKESIKFITSDLQEALIKVFSGKAQK